MSWLRSRLVFWLLVVRRQLTPAGFALVWGVAAWWLLLVATIAFLSPAPAESATTGYVNLPGLPSVYSTLPIPLERLAFDEAQRGYRESSEAAIDHAHTAYEWIEVSHGQAVRIITRDGEAVEVELLEGRHTGRHGWMKTSQLAPWPPEGKPSSP